MTNNENTASARMAKKIERSSLGTPAARQLRSRTPAAVSSTIVAASRKRAVKRR